MQLFDDLSKSVGMIWVRQDNDEEKTLGLSEIEYTDEEKEFIKGIMDETGYPESESKEILDKCIKLAEKKGLRGVSNFGDIEIKKEGAFDKKSKAGLSREDFLKYWNRPWVEIAIEAEVANIIRFVTHYKLCQKGVPEDDAIKQIRKYFIYYGYPEKPHPNFLGQDADIYPEFQIRYEKWRVQYSVPEERKMMEKYSTCNAMVRDLIAKGEL
tara:strand:- start:176 stop:811 length:636 start_codon:yes stop_codon:yes gene_type:complete